VFVGVPLDLIFALLKRKPGHPIRVARLFFWRLEKFMKHHFLSTAIPYVNASPHIGFALELAIADVIARHQRQRGNKVYFLSGTDDNSLKNALAAEAVGVSTEAFVEAHAREFKQLKGVLNISYNDFLATSTDPRHAPAVEKLWRQCDQNGDIYRGNYEGLYCVGCEQFYTQDELQNGICPEHGTEPDAISEENYFFRLSRYQDDLIRLIGSNEITVRPTHRKKEVLSFLESPLLDLSISRNVARARSWGLPVPGDSSQIIYVWFDALANYISALGYAGDEEAFETYWVEADRISHVIGKGVTRFHAVYWPAILLSAGLRLPTEILVHGYITVDGRKISKTLGNTISPRDACDQLGADALRYYLLRHIGSQRDGDFSWARLNEVYEHELANDLGNLLSRATALGRRYGPPASRTATLADGLSLKVATHIDEFAVDRALDAIWRVVTATNAYVNQTEPWALAKEGKAKRLAEVLSELYGTLTCIGHALIPFLPSTAHRLLSAVSSSSSEQLFPKLGR
jgi:methionyl-tRNA synthetase